MSEPKLRYSVSSLTDSLKSLDVIVSFSFKAHNHHITEQASNDLAIYLRRYMRHSSLPNMIMKAPPNTLMGYDTTMEMKYLGQPARHFPWKLTINDETIQIGQTDHGGYSYGLDVALSHNCVCLPYWFKANYGTKPLNDRCCDRVIPLYNLTVYKPKPKNGPEEGVAIETASDPYPADETQGSPIS